MHSALNQNHFVVLYKITKIFLQETYFTKLQTQGMVSFLLSEEKFKNRGFQT